MWSISYFVGAKFGTWITGSDRFTTQDAAQSQADHDKADEHCAGATKFARRVVRV